METVVIYVALVLVGLCFGSFAGASVWRLRARQLTLDKKAGEKVSKKEYAQLRTLTTHSMMHDHSQCLECGHKLAWYDLIPLMSWLSLGGRCRYCRRKIGYFEPLIELAVAGFFVLSYAIWPYALVSGVDITRLLVWLASGVVLAMLFAYDLKWFLLPNKLVFTVIALGIVNVAVVAWQSHDVLGTLATTVGAIAILSGLYLLLYAVSRGRWVGFGDVKLGLGLALTLADWRLAFIALFAANLAGCLVVIPGLVTRRLGRSSRIPFGPLLIIGYVVAGLVGSSIVTFYTINLL